MSDLERDYTRDVPEELTLQQALDRRLGSSRAALGKVLRHASIEDLSNTLQAAWLHDASVYVEKLDKLPADALGVDLSERTEVVEIDTISSLCTVERCATPSSIAEQLAAEGLWLEVGHFSDANAPIGPAIEHGEAAALVVSLSAVLADGTHFSTPLAPRRATGPNPDYALIGGKGRTGIITHATLRVRSMPDWDNAVEIKGPTQALLDAVRKTLRTYRPTYAWMEQTRKQKARLVIIPGVHPVPIEEFSTFDVTGAASPPAIPTPRKKQAKRVGWRALQSHFEATNCWAGPLDTHGGWVRGPKWPLPEDTERFAKLYHALDPAEVLR